MGASAEEEMRARMKGKVSCSYIHCSLDYLTPLGGSAESQITKLSMLQVPWVGDVIRMGCTTIVGNQPVTMTFSNLTT